MSFDGFMFDTNIFNRILEGDYCLSTFENAEANLWATHIQEEEIKKTLDKSRKIQLLNIFFMISEETPAAISRGGLTPWGRGGWSSNEDSELYDKFWKKLGRLNKKKRIENNKKDAIIAITALKRSLVLVTTDPELREVVSQHGGKVIGFDELIIKLGIEHDGFKRRDRLKSDSEKLS